MIKIENVEVSGYNAAMRGMRNPMNSWDKSDSEYCWQWYDEECPKNCPYRSVCDGCTQQTFIGPNDLKLAKKLVLAGSDHSKFMRFIDVSLDITAPLYWWKEFDTYKVGTVRNSCSTMHKIHDKEFTLEDFSNEHLIRDDDPLMDSFESVFYSDSPINNLECTIDKLNECRRLFMDESVEDDKKIYWWQMIQLLPSSYNQRATIKLNYEVLRNIYFARRNHKLDEWRKFCEWIESLPYSELITATKEKEKEVTSDISLEGIEGYIYTFESAAKELRKIDCGELADRKQKVADWLKDYVKLRKEMINGR
jgi:hypothetical protein